MKKKRAKRPIAKRMIKVFVDATPEEDLQELPDNWDQMDSVEKGKYLEDSLDDFMSGRVDSGVYVASFDEDGHEVKE